MNHRTRRLVEALAALQHQRANLEHEVTQRTAELRAAKEEAEALSRKTALAESLRNHLSTQLLLGAWPQARLEIRIQERAEQDGL